MEGMYDADYNEEAYERALRNAEIKFKNHQIYWLNGKRHIK